MTKFEWRMTKLEVHSPFEFRHSKLSKNSAEDPPHVPPFPPSFSFRVRCCCERDVARGLCQRCAGERVQVSEWKAQYRGDRRDRAGGRGYSRGGEVDNQRAG